MKELKEAIIDAIKKDWAQAGLTLVEITNAIKESGFKSDDLIPAIREMIDSGQLKQDGPVYKVAE